MRQAVRPFRQRRTQPPDHAPETNAPWRGAGNLRPPSGTPAGVHGSFAGDPVVFAPCARSTTGYTPSALRAEDDAAKVARPLSSIQLFDNHVCGSGYHSRQTPPRTPRGKIQIISMSFRFRRFLSIFPGLRLNFGKKGISASVGVKGAHITIGKDGVRSTVGLPGTGLSYTETHSIGVSDASSKRLENASLRVEESRLRLERLSAWTRKLDEWSATKTEEVFVFHKNEVKGPIDLFSVTFMVTSKIAPEDVQICRVGTQEWGPIPTEILTTAMRMNGDFPLYYYMTSPGEKVGPCAGKTLKELVSQQRLSRETPVFMRGDEQWKTVADFPELLTLD